MADDITARLALPLLQAGQAQKETTHNEALTLLDLLVQPAVLAVGTQAPPAGPAPGDAWILGSAPTGAWAGQAFQLAVWTSGGWRFVAATEGMSAWSRADSAEVRFAGGTWTIGVVAGRALVLAGHQVVGTQQAGIANVSGGSVIDVQARAALAAILGALRAHGLIAG